MHRTNVVCALYDRRACSTATLRSAVIFKSQGRRACIVRSSFVLRTITVRVLWPLCAFNASHPRPIAGRSNRAIKPSITQIERACAVRLPQASRVAVRCTYDHRLFSLCTQQSLLVFCVHRIIKIFFRVVGIQEAIYPERSILVINTMYMY